MAFRIPGLMPIQAARAARAGTPAVSAGIYGWPVDDAARIAVATVRETRTAVEEVRFVLFDDRTYRAFARQLS